MSRLDRLSARAYARLRPEQQEAADLLRYGQPGDADRGEAKTVLGWSRTREETIAYARRLLEAGLMPSAVADRLGITGPYLGQVLDLENPPRNPSIHAAETGLTDSPKVIGHPGSSEAQSTPSVYGGDPFAYDLEAALRRKAHR